MDQSAPLETRKKRIGILTIAVVAAVLIGTVCAVLFVYEPQKAEQSVTVEQGPQKTDYGTATPPDFPADIPLESGAAVSQSYSLNYAGQQQLTLVFTSAKSVKENYTLYSEFLAAQGWSITNKYESEKLASLYAQKDADDINITITQVQVSISVLQTVAAANAKDAGTQDLDDVVASGDESACDSLINPVQAIECHNLLKK